MISFCGITTPHHMMEAPLPPDLIMAQVLPHHTVCHNDYSRVDFREV